MSWLMSMSKKTSESGVWLNDEEVHNCNCCGVQFSFVIRKHHCRQCGYVVCGPCSENRKFLESSRSGAPKRICDKCFAGDRADMDEATAGVAAVSVADDSSHGAGASAEPKRPGPGLPAISQETAVKALKDHPFEGTWKCALSFLVVELGRPSAEVAASSLSVGAIKKVDARSGRKSLAPPSSPAGDPSQIKPGGKYTIELELELKGAAYFKGSCVEFAHFGKDGKITGSLQRTNGKVNMTIQMVAMKMTTSFNFVGLMNESGVLMGTFSGCEISKSAGTVSGTFKMMREGGGDDEEAPAKSPTKKASSRKLVAESDEDEKPAKKSAPKKSASHSSDEEEATPSKKSAKKPAKKTSDSESDTPVVKKSASKKKVSKSESEEEPVKKSASKKKIVADSDSEAEEVVKKPAAKSKKHVSSEEESDTPVKKTPVRSTSKKAAEASDSD